MLFNCLKCAHVISSRKDICPYCHVEISAFSNLKTKTQKRSLKARYKNTIFSVVLK